MDLSAYAHLEEMSNESNNEKDMVNSPSHYKVFQTEAIDIIKDALTLEQFKGYLLGNMLKYRLRAGFKDKKKKEEDLKKSNWYQDKFESITGC